MNARELLAEVQKTPGYAESKPNYDAILSLITAQRPVLKQVVQRLEPRLDDPFDSIETAIEQAASTVQRTPSLQRTASLFFKSMYDTTLSGLDFYVKAQRRLEEGSSGLVRDLKSKHYDPKKPFMGGVARERDAIVRTQEAESQRRTEITGEVAALKELVRLYVEATLHKRDMNYLLGR